jgi:hypothetical protein
LVRNILHFNKFSVSHNLEAHKNECMSAYSIGFFVLFPPKLEWTGEH